MLFVCISAILAHTDVQYQFFQKEQWCGACKEHSTRCRKIEPAGEIVQLSVVVTTRAGGQPAPMPHSRLHVLVSLVNGTQSVTRIALLSTSTMGWWPYSMAWEEVRQER